MFLTVAGGLLVATALLILPVALFVRPIQILTGLMGLALILALVLLAGNYFWPIAGVLILGGGLLALRRGRHRELAAADARCENEPQIAGRRFPDGIEILPILVLMLAGWLFLFLPDLVQVVPILPADSPPDFLSWKRIQQDFLTNRSAALFALPWLVLLFLGGLGRSWNQRRAGGRGQH